MLGSRGGTCCDDQLGVLRPSQLQAFQATPSLPFPSNRFSAQSSRGNFERLAYNKGSDIFVDFICCVLDLFRRLVESFCSIINPLSRVVDPLSCAAGPLGSLFNPPCRLFDPPCCLVDSLCRPVGPRSRFFDLLGILVNALLYRCLSKASE